MGIQDLQDFVESDAVPGACVTVDLLRIARTAAQMKKNPRKSTLALQNSHILSLVVDGECCLDRLYGGFFSDWACGGQWNRMVQFLATLIQTVQVENVRLSFFFNGCLESQRMPEWISSQLEARQNINQVLRHISLKGTPPPKVWWTPPACLRTCLRMALRHLGVGLMCTMDDHHQEVIAFCRENGCSGLMADDGEYVAFDPPRYFSSEHIKLTYKGSLETREYVLSEVTKSLGVTGDRLCVLATLLGSSTLPASDLADVYQAALGVAQPDGKIPLETLLRKLSELVVSLPPPSDQDALVAKLFPTGPPERAQRFRNALKYFLNGTKDGFLSYKPQLTARRDKSVAKVVVNGVRRETAPPKESGASDKQNGIDDAVAEEPIKKEPEESMDYSRLTTEDDLLEDQREETQLNELDAPLIVVEPPAAPAARPATATAPNGLLLSSSSSSSSSSTPSPSHATAEGGTMPDGKAAAATDDKARPPWQFNVPHEVMRTACERHEKGLMSPLIYQIFTQGEVKFPVVLEDEGHKEVPNIQLFFRPVRQMVYAVLFNVHHQKYLASKTNGAKDSKVEASSTIGPLVKEWVWSRDNPYRTPHLVAPEPLSWGVPTIQRLWFGTSADDRRRRLRAFLTCMRSDSALMLNTSFVPQHSLILAATLRYIMTSTERPVLRRAELDACIAHSFYPELTNAHHLQEMQVGVVSPRGVTLAALLMTGIEHALLAVDACGAPIPWLVSCPWLFVDGKLLQQTLARSAAAKNILELCDRRLELVVKVERMRQAVLDGLDYKFALIPIPGPTGPLRHNCPPPPGIHLQGYQQSRVPRGGLSCRGGAGGRLEVAGVVVGQWGPNLGSRGGRGFPSPRGFASRGFPVTTARGGFAGRGNYGGQKTRGTQNGGPTMLYGSAKYRNAPAGRSTNASVPAGAKADGTEPPKKKNSGRKKKAAKGRGLTVATKSGETMLAAVAKLTLDDTPPKLGQFDDATCAVLVNGTQVNGEAKVLESGQGDH